MYMYSFGKTNVKFGFANQQIYNVFYSKFGFVFVNTVSTVCKFLYRLQTQINKTKH